MQIEREIVHQHPGGRALRIVDVSVSIPLESHDFEFTGRSERASKLVDQFPEKFGMVLGKVSTPFGGELVDGLLLEYRQPTNRDVDRRLRDWIEDGAGSCYDIAPLLADVPDREGATTDRELS